MVAWQQCEAKLTPSNSSFTLLPFPSPSRHPPQPHPPPINHKLGRLLVCLRQDCAAGPGCPSCALSCRCLYHCRVHSKERDKGTRYFPLGRVLSRAETGLIRRVCVGEKEAREKRQRREGEEGEDGREERDRARVRVTCLPHPNLLSPHNFPPSFAPPAYLPTHTSPHHHHHHHTLSVPPCDTRLILPLQPRPRATNSCLSIYSLPATPSDLHTSLHPPRYIHTNCLSRVSRRHVDPICGKIVIPRAEFPSLVWGEAWALSPSSPPQSPAALMASTAIVMLRIGS